MTSKEAKGNLMYALKWTDMPEKEALKIAIKALDNEDVLDKLRAEIEQMDFDYSVFYDHTSTIREMVLEVIDKYKA